MIIAMRVSREYIVRLFDFLFIQGNMLIHRLLEEIRERLGEHMQLSEIRGESLIVVRSRLPECYIHTVTQGIIFRIDHSEDLVSLSDSFSGTSDRWLVSCATGDIRSMLIRWETSTHIGTPSHRLELSILFFFGIFFFDFFDFLWSALLDIDLYSTEYG